MIRLQLEFQVGNQHVVLDRTRFTHPWLRDAVYPNHTVACHRQGGHGFQWRSGIQALTAFLIRSRHQWLTASGSDDERTYRLSGRRVSLASSLNDLITKGSNSVQRMFGVERGVPLFGDLFERANPDFKNATDDDVIIRLNHNLLSPNDIQVLLGGVAVQDLDELNRLADNIERQWNAAHGPRLSTPRAVVTPTAPSPRQTAWREGLEQLHASAGFRQIDHLWGQQYRAVIQTGDPEGEAELLAAPLPEPWRTLCHCHVLLRHGRWTEIVKRLRPGIYDRMRLVAPTDLDAVWGGRAANLMVLAAMRLGDEDTVRECLGWVERLCGSFSGSEPLRAQMLHHRARFRWRCRYHDLELAGIDLDAAWRLYESLPNGSPWRDLGLSQVADSRAEYLADIGDMQRAVESFRDSISRKQQLGDRYGQSLSHGKLGRLLLEAYELEQAERELTTDLQITRQLQDRRGESVVLMNLAEVYLMAAETEPREAAEPLARALPHLDAALALARDSGNETGIGLALIGKARRLLLPAHVDRADLDAAAELARQGHDLVARCTRRPEWKRYAQLWLGWALAKRAESAEQLNETDERYFVTASEDLRAAGLRMDLAEALYQRARMLMSEGQRLGINDHAREKTIDCLCEAWEHAGLMQVKTLTQRYLRLARAIDPDLWLRTVTRAKQETARLSASNQRLQTLVEDRSNVLLLASHELIEPLHALSDLQSPIPGANPPRLPPHVLSTTLERLTGVAQTLRLLSQPLDARPWSGVDAPPGAWNECRVDQLLRRVCRNLDHTVAAKGVTIEAVADATLVWTTIEPVLDCIVQNLAYHAVSCAKTGTVAGEAGRVRLSGRIVDDNLWIDLENTGRPFELEHGDWTFPFTARAVGDIGSDTPADVRGMYLALYLARRLGGDVTPLYDSAAGWIGHIRVSLPPRADRPPKSRGE